MQALRARVDLRAMAKKKILRISQDCYIIGASPSDYYVSYHGHSFGGGGLTPLQRSSRLIVQLQPTGRIEKLGHNMTVNRKRSVCDRLHLTAHVWCSNWGLLSSTCPRCYLFLKPPSVYVMCNSCKSSRMKQKMFVHATIRE